MHFKVLEESLLTYVCSYIQLNQAKLDFIDLKHTNLFSKVLIKLSAMCTGYIYILFGFN